jgi:single-stranded DNA-binding protein
VNAVWLVGTLGADPIRLKGGVVELRVQTPDGEWHRVRVPAALAGVLPRRLKADDPIVVHGRLRARSYEKNGERRYAFEVEASRVVAPSAWARA